MAQLLPGPSFPDMPTGFFSQSPLLFSLPTAKYLLQQWIAVSVAGMYWYRPFIFSTLLPGTSLESARVRPIPGDALREGNEH